MYRIRVKTNKRIDEYGKDDYASIGVRMKNGGFRYVRWHGFTLHMVHPVKLLVESCTLEPAWDPRDPGSTMPRWYHLRPGEFLLGSYDDSIVATFLPFTIVTETGLGGAPGRDDAHQGRS